MKKSELAAIAEREVQGKGMAPSAPPRSGRNIDISRLIATVAAAWFARLPLRHSDTGCSVARSLFLQYALRLAASSWKPAGLH
jgi:hypothetical protein